MQPRHTDQPGGAAQRSRRRAKQHEERLRRDRRGLERELQERVDRYAEPFNDPDPLPLVN